MPFRKYRKYRRRPPYRRRRFYRRKRRVFPRTTAHTGSLTCKQKVLDSSIVIPAGGLPNGHVEKLSFELQDLQQWGTFANLFDQYKLNGVKVDILPTNNTNDITNAGGTFVSSIDLDHDSTISTFSDILQCSNAKTSSWSSAGGLTQRKSCYLRPRAQNLINSGNVDATGAPIWTTSLLSRKVWMDMGDRGKTKFHGLILGWDINGGAGLVADQPVNMIITYYLQFRKVR